MFYRLVNVWIHLRNRAIQLDVNNSNNDSLTNKIKLAANVYMLFGLISLVFIPILLWFQLYLQVFFAALTFVLNLLLLRFLNKKNGVEITAHVLCSTIIIVSSVQMIYSQGNVNFITVSWLVVAVIFSFFQIGKKVALRYLFISVNIMLVFVLLKIFNFPFPNYNLSSLYYYIGAYISLCLVFGFIYIIIEQVSRHNANLIFNLKSNEEKLMNIIQNLPTAALYVDRGKIFCNQHFIKLTGYQPDAFHSVQHLFELLFAENNQESIEKLYQNEVAISNPVQLKTLKQDLKMVTVHQFQELDYKIIVFNDITALKNSEKLLNKSNYFIENLAEAVPHILFIFDIEKNKSIYVNDAVFTILQFSKSDLLLFQNIYEIAHPDDVLNIKQHIEFLKKMEDNDTAVLEYRLKNKSGNYLWFRSTQKIFKRNKNGATRQVIGVAENINELRERTLRNEKNILFLNRINAQAHHFFTKKLPDAFLSDFLESIAKVVDADSITIYQKNEHDILEVKFEWLSGSATKQQAKKIPAYLSEKLSLFEANQLLKIVANKSCVAVPIFIEGTFWGITDFVFHPENNVFHYIQDDVWKNFSLYLAGLFLKQKIDEEILQQKNIAEYASKIKSAFLNSISHEINTPLNIISGISETLPSENLVNEINKSDILLLKHSALDLKYLVEQIVVFNKIQPKENFSVNTRFDVKQWIEELQQDLLWIQSDENQPQLQWQIDENLPKTLTGKPLKLQHALKGIVQHFCKKKSSEKIHIIIGVEQENEQVVALNFTLGHPIVLKDLNRFSYLDLELKTLIENPSGLGINLLVALYIIQSLDGKIISISLDKDFQLSFNIPFQKEAVAIKPFDVDLSNKRILVIDDNEINMLILRKYLEKVNAQVTTINAAQEAIDLLKVEKFDAILLDWLMPEIDGAATLVELKKNKITTPVIATSAAAFSELKNQFNEYSIAAFLPKPITSELLYQKLTEVMRSKENVI